MANFKRKKGVIAILTGGGDVPGLNPAIRAITIRATMEGYQVLGIRRGWAGAIGIIRDKEANNSEHCVTLTEEIGPTGLFPSGEEATFSRTELNSLTELALDGIAALTLEQQRALSAAASAP